MEFQFLKRACLPLRVPLIEPRVSRVVLNLPPCRKPCRARPTSQQGVGRLQRLPPTVIFGGERASFQDSPSLLQTARLILTRSMDTTLWKRRKRKRNVLTSSLLRPNARTRRAVAWSRWVNGFAATGAPLRPTAARLAHAAAGIPDARKHRVHATMW